MQILSDYAYQLNFVTTFVSILWTLVQPQIFRKLRADLASMWSPSNKGAYPRRISAKASWSSIQENDSVHEDEAYMSDEDITSIKVSKEDRKCAVSIRPLYSLWLVESLL